MTDTTNEPMDWQAQIKQLAPFENPDVAATADNLIRWAATQGAVCAARAVTYIGPVTGGIDTDAAKMALWRYFNNTSMMQHCHDTVLLLKALREIAPVRADRVAAEIVAAAEDGSSYGEWLWQWAEEAGVDIEPLCEAAHEAAEREIANERKTGEATR